MTSIIADRKGVCVRNYGDNIEIDPKSVKEFYNKRFDPNRPLASVMMHDDEEMLRKRDENEKKQVLRLFNLNATRTRMLDLGCGNGRWYEALRELVWAYDGVDFSEPNIFFARINRKGPRVNFVIRDSEKINNKSLPYAPYDFVLSCGLFMYLNENQLVATFKAMLPLLQPTAQLYFRTSVSVLGHRLTLKDFPSEALKARYNVIYRTPLEYESYFNDFFVSAGFDLVSSELLLDERIGANKETNQQYWFLERSNK
jgi:SAM-dependent methyltransferase